MALAAAARCGGAARALGVDAHRAAVLAVLADLQALPIALVGAALWFSRRS